MDHEWYSTAEWVDRLRAAMGSIRPGLGKLRAGTELYSGKAMVRQGHKWTAPAMVLVRAMSGSIHLTRGPIQRFVEKLICGIRHYQPSHHPHQPSDGRPNTDRPFMIPTKGQIEQMMYELLPGRTHQLSITGPELADIAELIASLAHIGGHAGPAGFKLFHALGFQKVYEESKLAQSRQSCFEKVYKYSEDGTFQLTFTDSEYLSIANLLIWVIDLSGEADTIGRELFDALGFQHAFEEFINSPEGRDIFIRSSPEEGHA